ncbi:DUF992 domain-containing protein [Bradyrhizobium sp. 18BD]
MRTIRSLCILCVSAVVCVGVTPARAEAFRVGRLLCAISPRIGFLVGSTQSLRCVFYPRGASRRYIYEGRIRRIGFDLGITGSSVLSWTVFARNSQIRPGTMRGNYVGASGNIALGPGLGANVLVGGSRRSVALQPLSIERAVGLNLAATVTHLMLR